ncbi:MAG: hypothetical protein N2Z74_10450, partial [Syntrophales bacterium]|nr:hypothetical protein [Syntrophales bacterium]
MRSLKGWLRIIVLIYAVAASLFHLYTSGWGTFEPRTQRGLHLLLLLPLVYLLYPATSKSPKERPSVFDILASVLCFVAPAYVVFHADRLNFRMGGISEAVSYTHLTLP